MSPSLSRVQTIPAPVLAHLTGISADQLARLLAEVGPAWEADRAQRLERPDRRRAQGAGRKHTLNFSARLVMILMYLRWNISYRALGGLFGVSKDAVLRAMDDLLPLLADHGITAPDGKTRLGGEPDLLAALAELSDGQRAALVDGTFVPVARPGGGWEDQKRLYNPHKHRHTRNFQAITDSSEQPWGDPASTVTWLGLQLPKARRRDQRAVDYSRFHGGRGATRGGCAPAEPAARRGRPDVIPRRGRGWPAGP